MSKARMHAVKMELPSVGLQTVVPSIPRDPAKKEQLKADLKKMGCKGFLLQPWTLKSREMVQEFLQPHSNEWEGTIQRLPEKRTIDSWADVYDFRKDGRMVAGRTDRWINGKFRSPINSKDRHSVEDCVDPRERRILEFVVPIIYPEKPKQVTKIVGNTILGSLSGEYLVNWG